MAAALTAGRVEGPRCRQMSEGSEAGSPQRSECMLAPGGLRENGRQDYVLPGPFPGHVSSLSLNTISAGIGGTGLESQH